MADLKEILAKLEALSAQNEALATKIEELEKAGKSGGDTKAIEASIKKLDAKVVELEKAGKSGGDTKAIEAFMKKLDAKVVKLEKAAKQSGSSVTVSKEKKIVPVVPTKTFEINGKEYRCKVAKLSIGGKAMTAQDLLDGPAAQLGMVLETYPGLFEAVK